MPDQHARQLVESFNAQGNALTAVERFAEAETAFRAAIAIDPNCGPVWNNLANLYHFQAKLDPALEAYKKAIAASPRLAPAYNNLGNLLRMRGQLPRAIAALRKAVELDPTSAAVHSSLVYAVCFDPHFNAHQILEEARGWADRHESHLLQTHRPHDNDPDPNRRLQIGYVSPDFRQHVIGRNVLPILEHHDRGNFEIHCFSTLERADELTPKFVRASDRWHDCAALTDADLAEKIRSERIDILIDLTLHCSGNRLLTFARKPAPLQVTWAGYPGTTGLQSIDYRITDPYLDPPGETDQFCSEESIRLPHSFWCYRPSPETPVVNALPALNNGTVTFGCLNNPAKATENSLDLWADVLRTVPGSQLLMLSSEGTARDDFESEFLARGISSDRIAFVPLTSLPEHLSRYHQIDICLDPVPYTGHTTTLDALWMGVPVITLVGQTSLARGSVTALSNLNMQELIARTPEQFTSVAAAFAHDVPRLVELRRALRGRMQASPLCDERRFTADLEAVYRRIWIAFHLKHS